MIEPDIQNDENEENSEAATVAETQAENGTETPKSGDEGSKPLTDRVFSDFGLSEDVLAGISAKGYEHPTAVQDRVIEPGLAGKDLIVRSKTGTGKTAAFGIPMVHLLDGDAGTPQGLVLCPTRELAIQVADELGVLGGPAGHQVVAIYGGASMQKQIDGLKGGATLVVGTPGRVLDHIRRGNLDLSGVSVRALDEADEMLSMGFFEEVMGILKHTPDDAQTLLFSATISPDIETIIGGFTKDPETILLSGDEFSVEGIENILYETREDTPKPRCLLYLVEEENPTAALIFCNTRDDTSMVMAMLNKHGLDAERINSDLSQNDRERVMGKIKSGELRFMVATDLAARGIDISGLTHVINYSLPEDPAIYMHRVGRTGRIGKAGKAISLFSGRDLHTLKALTEDFGVDFDRRELPDDEEARKQWAARHISELKEEMDGSVFEAYLPLAREIVGRDDSLHLFAFALKSFFSKGSRAVRVPSGKPSSARSRSDRDDRGGRDRDRGGRDRDRDRGGRDRDRGGRDRDRGGRDRDRGGRDSRGSREPSEPTGNRVYVGLGEEAGINEEALRALLANAASVSPEALGSIDVTARASFLEPEADILEALLALDGSDHDGHALKVEKARARPPRRDRDDRDDRDEPAPSGNRVYVGLGEEAGLNEDDLRALLSQAASLEPDTLGDIDVTARASFLEPEPTVVEALLALDGSEHDGHALKVEKAKARRRRRR